MGVETHDVFLNEEICRCGQETSCSYEIPGFLSLHDSSHTVNTVTKYLNHFIAAKKEMMTLPD